MTNQKLFGKLLLAGLVAVFIFNTAAVQGRQDTFYRNKLWGVSPSFWFDATMGDVEFPVLLKAMAAGNCEQFFIGLKDAGFGPQHATYGAMSVRLFNEGICVEKEPAKAVELLLQSLYDASPISVTGRYFTPEYYYLAGKNFIENPTEYGGAEEATFLFQLAADGLAADLFTAIIDEQQGFPYTKEKNLFGFTKLEMLRRVSNEFLGPLPGKLHPKLAALIEKYEADFRKGDPATTYQLAVDIYRRAFTNKGFYYQAMRVMAIAATEQNYVPAQMTLAYWRLYGNFKKQCIEQSRRCEYQYGDINLTGAFFDAVINNNPEALSTFECIFTQPQTKNMDRQTTDKWVANRTNIRKAIEWELSRNGGDYSMVEIHKNRLNHSRPLYVLAPTITTCLSNESDYWMEPTHDRRLNALINNRQVPPLPDE